MLSNINKVMEITGIIIFALGVLFSFYFIIKEIGERSFLKKILYNIIGKEKIKSVEDLIAIKNYLQKNISYNTELKANKRPLLRHTASHILKSKYGFCGENARVAIKLLMLGGIKARRIYLFREVWEHVLIEHKMNNSWYMFDGHYDPSTLLKDHDVVSIYSEDIEKYPDDYPNNPYLDFCRIKLFYIIPPLKFLSKKKLPGFLSYIFESPYLIKFILGILIIITGIIIFYLS